MNALTSSRVSVSNSVALDALMRVDLKETRFFISVVPRSLDRELLPERGMLEGFYDLVSTSKNSCLSEADCFNSTGYSV